MSYQNDYHFILIQNNLILGKFVRLTIIMFLVKNRIQQSTHSINNGSTKCYYFVQILNKIVNISQIVFRLCFSEDNKLLQSLQRNKTFDHYMSSKKASLHKAIARSDPKWFNQTITSSFNKQEARLLTVQTYRKYANKNKQLDTLPLKTQRKHIFNQVVILHLQNLHRQANNSRSKKKCKNFGIKNLLDTKPLTSWSKNRQNNSQSKQQNTNVSVNNTVQTKRQANSQETKQFNRTRKKLLFGMGDTKQKSPVLNKNAWLEFSPDNQNQPCTIKTIHLQQRHTQEFKNRQLNTSLTNRVPLYARHQRYLSQFRKNICKSRDQHQLQNNSKQCLQPWKIYQSSYKIV